MKNICIIVNKYPNSLEPNVLVFVQQLIWSIADKGIKCTVICPLPINIHLKYLRFPKKKTEATENGGCVEIYYPKFIGFGQSYHIFGKSPAPLTTKLFTNAVCRVIDKFKDLPDAVYGHFITPSGIGAARVGRKYNIPAFMAYGEATYKTIHEFGAERVAHEFSSLCGVIAVSTQNKQMLLSGDVIEENKIGIFPNGYREERFFPRNKLKAREKFGFPKDAFIIGFVGSFDERKGIYRLEKAVEDLDGVMLACAGKGKLIPTSKKCIYAQSVSNVELPYFYSAMDIFVLPTLNEGCCNAIIEAMACGLPIISSNLVFNDDILDNTCSIRIAPNNIDEIQNAILKLKKNSKFRQELAKGSMEKAKILTLSNRAEKILDFIDNMIQHQNVKSERVI